jgi:hypothetical protein
MPLDPAASAATPPARDRGVVPADAEAPAIDDHEETAETPSLGQRVRALWCAFVSGLG